MMKIGVLKEQVPEKRVSCVPKIVSQLKNLNVDVLIEKSAGEEAFITDNEYKEAGGEVVEKSKVLNADVILSVNPPAETTISKLSENQVWISQLNPLGNPQIIDAFKSNGATAFAMELIPRSTRGQAMDVLSSMATISGYLAVLEAARSLPKFFPMFMSAAGTIKPSKVLILGAGVAGLQAIATARKLGAIVEVFDVREAVKEEVSSLGGKFIQVEGAKDDASAGGYAVEQTEEFKAKQKELIHNHAQQADVILCTAQIPGRKAPLLIEKKTVESMKPGSMIIDLAASSGGNCEVTKDGEKINHKGITIIGKSDYPSDMSKDASQMFSQNIFNFLKLILTEEGSLNLNFEDDIVKGTCAVHKGEIINERLKSIQNK